ncbi:FadR family transcriptional regulator [Pseudorhodobacter turbinis]|uniref:FadR family transcriptional regulator n=1 Tax=Pseudorhodobacter turbinis TaxID=2500533 RepID=A0A4P8ED16_9RHOB|nr:GntR family transcriptional regulator [Pseudorhodobacter turbinis]QCO54553.1 FadR family transcriptional regulator [Pseudorhodobacter turbinis]
MSEIDRNQGLARQIAKNIQDSIMQGRLSAAQRLPSEVELAERFSVSQPTVREAMKILAAKKLIQSKRGPKGGVFVSPPSLDIAAQTLHETTNWLVSLGAVGLADIVGARRSLGRLSIAAACEHAEREDHKRIEAALLELDHTEISDEDFCRLEVEFHQAVAAACPNSLLRLVMVMVNEALIPAANMISFPFRQRDKVVAMQRQVFSAILVRDAAEAISAFDTLIDYQSGIYDIALEQRTLGSRLR